MSDRGRELADKKLKALENKIKREYSKASKEAQKKLNDYLKQFEKEDSDMRKALLDGTITKERYNNWRTDKLMATNDWQITTDSLNSTFESAREVAAKMMTGHVKDIYALSQNYAEYEIEKDLKASLSFNLYDADTVTRLMTDNPKMLPNPGKKTEADIKAGKVKRWNKKHIQSSMLQSVLQGESLPMIAKRVAKSVGGMEERVAIRSARTMTTTAESAGRVDRYKAVSEMGIEMQEMWIATLDLHTRSSHRHLDGERVNVGETFSNGLRYPGDLNGSPEEVYNCRCTIGAVIPGTDLDKFGIEGVQRNSRLGDMSYEDWKKERDKLPKAKHQVVDGKDITETWKRRPDLFDFEIDDVINAQGFDGLPMFLDGKEFDDAVRAANGGEGFIAQRSYSAPSQEVLDAYREQLYSGKWYVDCGAGGAQYGQGMYCAADYTGALSDGIKEEMAHYKSLGHMRNYDEALKAWSKSLSLDSMKSSEYYNRAVKSVRKSIDGITEQEFFVWKKLNGTGLSGYQLPEHEIAIWEKMLDDNTFFQLTNIYDDMKKSIILDFNNVETFTLHPSARIIDYDELQKEWVAFGESLGKSGDINKMIYDLGSFAAAKGYDVINAVGHGQSGSYTVILNRTKVIFKRSK